MTEEHAGHCCEEHRRHIYSSCTHTDTGIKSRILSMNVHMKSLVFISLSDTDIALCVRNLLHSHKVWFLLTPSQTPNTSSHSQWTRAHSPARYIDPCIHKHQHSLRMRDMSSPMYRSKQHEHIHTNAHMQFGEKCDTNTKSSG